MTSAILRPHQPAANPARKSKTKKIAQKAANSASANAFGGSRTASPSGGHVHAAYLFLRFHLAGVESAERRALCAPESHRAVAQGGVGRRSHENAIEEQLLRRADGAQRHLADPAGHIARAEQLPDA